MAPSGPASAHFRRAHVQDRTQSRWKSWTSYGLMGVKQVTASPLVMSYDIMMMLVSFAAQLWSPSRLYAFIACRWACNAIMYHIA